MPTNTADRNLLFGILAIQMDFVRRDDLIEAMNAWVLDKSKPIEQILLERGSLKPEHQQLLEPLVAAHIRQHGDNAQKSLAALSSIPSLHDDLARVADTDLGASLLIIAQSDPEATRSIRSTIGTNVDEADGEAPTSRSGGVHSRFRIIRPYARGGLGEVYLARDEELGRQVALKEIQKRHAENSENRDRFVREAEITGGLEHPGIVPVYGLGHYEDGRPYYAMRFIRGASLEEAIEEFHGASFKSDRERNLKLRELLGRFVDVCNAIEYAHSRGVLHRDLKPGNIMLGKYGETLVVDWGLAKIAGRTEKHETDGDSTLSIAGSSGSSETLPGSAIGTPAFMSPEQAEGKLDTLGPATDVYSLGATLYMLLVGHPPFEGPAVEVLDRVKRGQFPPPHVVDRRVPKALSAICTKAMSKELGERYSSCSALGEDVEAWMADERVAAHQEPLLVKLGRFTRKHRTMTASLSALLLTAALSLLASTLWIAGEQSKTLLAKDEAERQKVLVEAREQEATQARTLADQTAVSLRKQLYVNQIALAQQELYDNQPQRAIALLDNTDVTDRDWEWNYLHGRANPILNQFTLLRNDDSKPSADSHLAASSDGCLIAVGNKHSIEIVDVQVGKIIQNISLETNQEVRFAAFAGKSRLITITRTLQSKVAAKAESKAANDKPTLKPSAPISRPAQPPAELPDQMLHVWELAGDRKPRGFDVGPGACIRLVTSPDGMRAFTLHADSRTTPRTFHLRVWSTEDGSKLSDFMVDRGYSDGFKFALSTDSNGRRVVVTHASGTPTAYETTDGSVVFKVPLSGAFASALSSDGERLAVSRTHEISVWSLSDGKRLFDCGAPEHFVTDLQWYDDHLVSTGIDATIRIWSVDKGKEIATIRSGWARVLWHSGEKTLAAVPRDGSLVAQLYDSRLASDFERPGTHPVLDSSWERLTYSPDGKWLAFLAGSHIELVDATTLAKRNEPGQ